MRTRGKLWTGLAAATVVASALPVMLRWLRRKGTARRAIDLRMTVVVEKPIHEVFEFARDFENFPKLIDALLSVEDSQDGRSHWAVRSPSGRTVEWDAAVSKYVPNSVIAWDSVPDSAVKASGLMRFSPLGPAETRVDISLTYKPLRTGFIDAIRSLVRSTNTSTLRTELAQASLDLGHAPEDVAHTPDEVAHAPEEVAHTPEEVAQG
ncbi:MAG TPA: SRPBCC family protein [Gemmatimonadaceae bacterium]